MVAAHHCCIFFFFFFQAEDGIRDLTVTGVQTCALPIYSIPAPPSGWPENSARPPAAPGSSAAPPFSIRRGNRHPVRPAHAAPRRSEERRVGKECSSGWCPCDDKQTRDKKQRRDDAISKR